jgi:hypothetical protein
MSELWNQSIKLTIWDKKNSCFQSLHTYPIAVLNLSYKRPTNYGKILDCEVNCFETKLICEVNGHTCLFLLVPK